ncbi:MAG: LPS assembly lipoprotein LptE [Burkholderiaceae bacterium]
MSEVHMKFVTSGNRSAGRRQLLGLGLGAGASALLAGCGFALRSAPSFSFQVLKVTGLENGGVTRAVRGALESAGVRTLGSNTPASARGLVPQVVMAVMVDQVERAVVGQTADGRVRELQLRTRYRFRLDTPSGRTLIEDNEVLMERDLSFSETAALSKSAEQELTFRDMQADIVQQVLRRLAAVHLG